jgi:hypothetical protein
MKGEVVGHRKGWGDSDHGRGCRVREAQGRHYMGHGNIKTREGA